MWVVTPGFTFSSSFLPSCSCCCCSIMMMMMITLWQQQQPPSMASESEASLGMVMMIIEFSPLPNMRRSACKLHHTTPLLTQGFCSQLVNWTKRNQIKPTQNPNGSKPNENRITKSTTFDDPSPKTQEAEGTTATLKLVSVCNLHAPFKWRQNVTHKHPPPGLS